MKAIKIRQAEIAKGVKLSSAISMHIKVDAHMADNVTREI